MLDARRREAEQRQRQEERAERLERLRREEEAAVAAEEEARRRAYEGVENEGSGEETLSGTSDTDLLATAPRAEPASWDAGAGASGPREEQGGEEEGEEAEYMTVAEAERAEEDLQRRFIRATLGGAGGSGDGLATDQHGGPSAAYPHVIVGLDQLDADELGETLGAPSGAAQRHPYPSPLCSLVPLPWQA